MDKSCSFHGSLKAEHRRLLEMKGPWTSYNSQSHLSGTTTVSPQYPASNMAHGKKKEQELIWQCNWDP